MTPLADEEARSRIRHDLETTLVVEAAAGTGKTTELVRRILSLLRSGASLSRIVAVTFTEKAAGEMKLRLRAEIEKARAAPSASEEEKHRLDLALSELEEARIGTIHGFCADLLRERAVEARVDPQFEVAAEEEKERLYGECFERWFQAALADPPEGVRRVLRRRARDRDALGPRLVLKRAGGDLIEQRDFATAWRRDPFQREQALDAIIARLDTLASFVAKADAKDDYLVQNLIHVRRFMSELYAKEAVRGARDYDGIEAELRDLVKGKPGKSWNWKGSSRGFRTSAVRKEALELRDRLRAEIALLIDVMDADLAACLHRELLPLVTAYEELKTRKGKLDFLDLLLLTRDLLSHDLAVRSELQARFSHLLVDEFQDTDPLQADILMLLSADDPAERDPYAARPIAGKLFVVGDPKQSIYRFRRADVALYEAAKRRLLARGAELVHLTTSFRSVPSIQAMVNAAFAPLMQGGEDGSQAAYVPLTPFRDEPEGRPTIVALPVPRPYSPWGKIVNFRIEESLPDAVGAFVDFLIRESGFTITEREDPTKRVPVQARHVCLLFKRFQHFGEDATRPYVRALEARHVPHVLVGGRSFHAREEVLAVRNALSAIEWPEDEFSVYATLRGPFFAVSDDALLAFRYPEGKLVPGRRLNPLYAPDKSELNELTQEVADSLAVLGRLHRGRNRRPIADTLTQLLEATRAHAGVAIWPTGEQALGNLLRVLDLARRFEASGATSFRSFVTRLDEEAERGGAAEAPVVEEGTDGVRIMTVHKAKGLEFPVVILVDPTAPATQRQPSRYVDVERKLWVMPLAGCAPVELLEKREDVLRHDAAEAVRLAYVAATRARELLVVPVVGDATAVEEGKSDWLDVLQPVLFPRGIDRRSSEPAPGCPAFGEDSVHERPESVHHGAEASVRPGRHAPAVGTHKVVFWDPSALALDKQDEVGLRQQRILAADEGESVANEGERLHAEWQTRRAALLERGALPSFRIATPTEAKEGVVATTAGQGAIDVRLDATEAPRIGRPHGKRFGILVHAVLSTIDLGAGAKRIENQARAQGRLLGATHDEIAAAAASVVAALRHPLLVRAKSAAACRRESPLSVKATDGTLIEGVLDLAFREIEAGTPIWTVVDFKTDVEIAGRREDYQRQVRVYADAVAAATGERARGVLLSV
ncbi:MAG TPA: UvrD-helicase domain-containing protein [Polyangiaceae bacterium]|jgi:ATP-dependent exoDNAse (exonuclease V) beta subunit|nr:UvrD-helicase domain-containing protein [Polyangiaceae bacterium]